MSDDNEIQKDVCDTGIEKPVPLKTLCPECKPNPNFMEPNWRGPDMEGVVFLNEKTCEYMVAVTKNKQGLNYTGAQFDTVTKNTDYKIKSFLRKFVQPAIEIMLADQGKLITEQLMCALYESPTMKGLTAVEMATTYSDFTLAYNTLQQDPINEGPAGEQEFTEGIYDDTRSTACDALDELIEEVGGDLGIEGMFTSGPVNPLALVVKMQAKLPKITNPFALELFGYAKEYYIGDDNTLRVLVALPAYILEKVPDNPTSDEIEESAMETIKLAKFDVLDLYWQYHRLKLALLSYSTYQALFFKSKSGKLYWQDGEDQHDFYCKSEAGEIMDFYNELKTFCKKNGWNIKSLQKSAFLNNASQIEIKFAKGVRNNDLQEIEYGESEDARYVIEKIKVKKKGCPWVELTKGIDRFAFNWGTLKRQTTLNYFAKLKEIDLALRARQSYPWLDFCVKFTYPLYGKPLTVNYGSMDPSNVEKTAGSCVANNAKKHLVDLKKTIFAQSVSFKEAMDFEYNQMSCAEYGTATSNEWEFLEIDVASQIGPGREAKVETRDALMDGHDNAAFDAELQRIQDQTQPYIQQSGSLGAEIESVKYFIATTNLDISAGRALADHVDQLPAKNRELRKLEKDLRDVEAKIEDLNEEKQKVQTRKSDYTVATSELVKNDIKKKEADLRKQLEDGDINQEQYDTQYNEALEAYNEDLKAKRKGQRQQKRIARKHGRLAARANRKERRNALLKRAKESAIAEFTNQQGTILEQMVDMEAFKTSGALTMKGVEDGDLKSILRRITMCNLNELVLGAVECLYSGIPLGKALERAVKAALDAMDVDVFGFFISALPPDDQNKLKEEFQKKFGDITLPWEAGYDSGSRDNTNVYIEWLKKPSESPEQEGAEEVTEEQPLPDETPYEFQQRKKREIQEWIENNYSYTTGEYTQPTTAGDYIYLREVVPSADGSGESEIKISIIKSPKVKSTSRDKPDVVDPVNEKSKFDAINELYKVEPTVEDYQLYKDASAAVERSESDQNIRLAASSTDEDGYVFDYVTRNSQWWKFDKDKRDRMLTSWNSEVSSDGTEHPGTFGSAFGDMEKMIVDAYIDYVMELLDIDGVLKILERFPGADILVRAIGRTSCAYQGMMDPPIQTGLKSFTLNPCGEKGVGLGFPEIDLKPNFFKGGKLTVQVEKKFVALIEKAIENLLKAILKKVLEIIQGSLTKLCQTVENQVSNILFEDSKGLDDAFREAFCEDADPIDLTDTKKKLFNSGGLKPSNQNAISAAQKTMSNDDEPLERLLDTLNATMTKQEVTSLIVNPPDNMDQNLLNKVASLTKNFVPEFADVFGSPKQVAAVFAHCGDFIPPEVKSVLKDRLQTSPPTPISNSVCLTNAQYEQWNENRIKLYTNRGLSRPTAQKMINDSNEKTLNDLEGLSSVMQKGADKMLEEAINEVMNPGTKSPPAGTPGDGKPECVDTPWDAAKSYIEEGDEHDQRNDRLVNAVFDSLEKTFLKDILSGRDGILNNILRDKNNFRLKKHERRASIPLWQPNYVDSKEQWEYRHENANALVKLFMADNSDGARGIFPETVGVVMMDQMTDTSGIAFTPSKDNAQIEMSFANSPDQEIVDYKFKISYKSEYSEDSKITVTVEDERIQKGKESQATEDMEIPESSLMQTILDLQITPTPPWERYTNFNYDSYRDSYPYQSIVFHRMLNNKYAIGSIPLSSSLLDTYSSINNKMLQFAGKAITSTPSGDTPVGFSFGLKDAAPLTFADLLYVNPDANPDDESTWSYTHTPMEKVLGKSATENPRVHFLDPAIHGGSYLFPKIYIEPQVHSGWMGMYRVFAPEVTQCEEGDNGFLNVTELSKRVSKLQKEIPFDDRLSLAPDCRVETPYDKHASGDAHAIIEGVVLATVKVYATEMLLKTLPLFGSVQMNENNIDQVLSIMIAKEIKKGMKEQTNFWNIIQGYTYYLTFLEQAVQVAQRQMKDKLLEKTPELEEAEDIIEEVQKNYKQIRLNAKQIIAGEFDWSVINPIIRGSAIIGFGEDDWEEEYRKIMGFDSSGIVAGAATGAAYGGATGGMLGATIGAAAGAAVATADDPGSASIAKVIGRLKFLTPFKIQMCRKISSLHDTRETAELFLGALVTREVKDMIKKMDFNLRPRPHIQNIHKYLLSKSGICLGSTLRSGETVIEQPTLEGGTGFDYGDVLNVAKSIQDNPLDGLEITLQRTDFLGPEMEWDDVITYLTEDAPTDPAELQEVVGAKISESLNIFKDGVFYLEKYIKETKQNGDEQIYNIEEYQNIIQSNPELYPPDSLISSVLGDAQTLDGQTFGSLGIEFGVRLIYCPPEKTVFKDLTERERPFEPEELTDEEVDALQRQMLSEREKSRTYLLGPTDVVVNFGQETFGTELEDFSGKTYALNLFRNPIPLAVYENSIPDVTFGELNLYDSNFGQDLKCYIDQLVLTKDFETLFNSCYPIRSYISLFGLYSYYGFFESIGKAPEGSDETQDDPSELREQWKDKVFKRTKVRLRRLFNSSYRNDGEVEEEKKGKQKFQKGAYMKSLMPKGFLNIDRSTTWWQTARVVTIKPLDPEGKDCMNAFQKIFKSEE